MGVVFFMPHPVHHLCVEIAGGCWKTWSCVSQLGRQHKTE